MGVHVNSRVHGKEGTREYMGNTVHGKDRVHGRQEYMGKTEFKGVHV